METLVAWLTIFSHSVLHQSTRPLSIMMVLHDHAVDHMDHTDACGKLSMTSKTRNFIWTDLSSRDNRSDVIVPHLEFLTFFYFIKWNKWTKLDIILIVVNNPNHHMWEPYNLNIIIVDLEVWTRILIMLTHFKHVTCSWTVLNLNETSLIFSFSPWIRTTREILIQIMVTVMKATLRWWKS